MLTERQAKAVGMLFELTDEEVARKLEIKRATMERWKRDPEFVRAIVDRIADNRQAAVRILSGLFTGICRELADLIRSDGDNARIKLLVDVLKAAGLFKEAVQAVYMTAEEGDQIGKLLEKLADEED